MQFSPRATRKRRKQRSLPDQASFGMNHRPAGLSNSTGMMSLSVHVSLHPHFSREQIARSLST